MKRSKTQAVYRFLPDMWISEKEDSTNIIVAQRIGTILKCPISTKTLSRKK